MPTGSKSGYQAGKSVGHHKAARVRARVDAYLDRRPHRSFRRTRRRDYVRPLVLPGLFAFTHEVTKTVWKQWRIFLPLMLIYIVFYAVLVGVGSQDTYSELTGFFSENGGELVSGGFGALAQSGLTIATLAISGLNAQPTEAQQIFAVLLGIMAWLTTVWLLRNILAGHKVRLRDGLYNAGAPLISSTIIVFVIALQLLPVALAAVGYSAATASGLIAGGGVPAMVFWVSVFLLAVLSLYFITSSLLALTIVTLPGMYPYRALKAAGDIVMGRRLTILFRWVWMILSAGVMWIIILLPIVLIDMGVKSLWPALGSVPIVPVGLVLASTYVIFWSSAYVYLLYRKVVDNESV